MEAIGTFTLVDYLVFTASIAVSLGIGIFFAIWDRYRKKNTPDDYFLAGRKGRVIPVGLSFLVTFISSLLFVGNPTESYLYGGVFALNGIGNFLATVFAAIFVVPIVHPLKLTTIYEYLALRFGDNVLRYVTLTIGLLYGIFYMGTVTYGISVVFEVVIGIPYWGSVLIFSVVTSLYTSIGGIKAVIWTDTFQFIIMVSGLVAIISKATHAAGGWSNVVELAGERTDLNQWSLDPRKRLTVWNLIFGSFTSMLAPALMQPGIQRIYSTPSTKAARRMLLLAAPFIIIICGAASLEGVVLFSYFSSKGCDIIEAGVISNVNQLVPFAVMDIFRSLSGLTGLFVATLLCAALSTLSSFLNSMSAIVFEDIIKVRRPDVTAHKSTNIARVLTFVFGAVSMVATFLISVLPGTIVSLFLGIVGCLDGPMCAIFVLAAASKRTTTKGILVGTISGMALAFWINAGKMFSNLPPDATLPPGPTHGCDSYIGRNHSILGGDASLTTVVTTNDYTLTMVSNNSSTHAAESNDLSPFDELYRTSYMLISLIGFLTSITVGSIVSCFTTPQLEVDERCIFSFRKHIIEELFTKREKTDIQGGAAEEMPMIAGVGCLLLTPI